MKTKPYAVAFTKDGYATGVIWHAKGEPNWRNTVVCEARLFRAVMVRFHRGDGTVEKVVRV